MNKKQQKNIELFTGNWTAVISLYLLYLQNDLFYQEINEILAMSETLKNELKKFINIELCKLENLKELKNLNLLDSIEARNTKFKMNDSLVKLAKVELLKSKIQIECDEEGDISFSMNKNRNSITPIDSNIKDKDNNINTNNLQTIIKNKNKNLDNLNSKNSYSYNSNLDNFVSKRKLSLVKNKYMENNEFTQKENDGEDSKQILIVNCNNLKISSNEINVINFYNNEFVYYTEYSKNEKKEENNFNFKENLSNLNNSKKISEFEKNNLDFNYKENLNENFIENLKIDKTETYKNENPSNNKLKNLLESSDAINILDISNINKKNPQSLSNYENSFRNYRKFIKSLTEQKKYNNISEEEDLETFSLNIKLIVDNRERGPNGEKITDEMRKINSDIICEERVLSVGDYLWIYSDPHTDIEYCLDYIIERKTLDDLAGSIKDGRYVEQKFRLKNTKLKNIYYLFEGNTFNSAYSCVSKGAVMTATCNTLTIHDFQTVKTNSFDDTKIYLNKLDCFIKHYYFTDKERLDFFNMQTFQDFMVKNAKTKSLSDENIFVKQLRCVKIFF